MTAEFTYEELLSEMLESLGDREQPTQEQGWFSFKELASSTRGLTVNQLREKANAMVNQGKWERLKWGVNMYYRQKLN